MGNQLVSHYTSEEPISVDEAREAISLELGIEPMRVMVGWVHASITESRDGTGALRGYRTEWQFTAEVNL